MTVRSAIQSCVVAHSQMNNPHGAPISREFKKTSTVSKRERAGKEHLDQQHFCATVFIITAAILSLSSTFQITVWAESLRYAECQYLWKYFAVNQRKGMIHEDPEPQVGV